ncbi:MAG TPA: LacI family DNA-binding transcriptional regulator [Mycobacteriales bacterium]|jgi:Transcriptional regulators
MNRVNEQRVTIRQVAQTAGVSIATVSRVFAGTTPVSDTLRQRVEEAARLLAYTPHEVARSLARGRTLIAAMLVPNLANPYVCGLIKRVLHEADRAGYRLIVADSDENDEIEFSLGVNLLQRGDGLIVYAPRGDVETVEALAEYGKPVVVLNRPVDTPNLSTVVVDEYHAMCQLAQHLADLGHRRVAYLHGPARSWRDAQRWRAVSGLSEQGVEVTAIDSCGALRDGYDAVPTALAAGCTAVMAFDDLTAFGVLSGLRDHGLRVPEDVSVTGFGDVPLSRCVSPTLTGACGRQLEAGTAAWQSLASMLDGGPPGSRIVLRAEAMIRSSTAPPPTG